MIVIKSEILEKARKDDKLIIQLAVANGKRLGSVINWFKEPITGKLTQYSNLAIIANYYGLMIPDILVNDTPSQMQASLLEEEINH